MRSLKEIPKSTLTPIELDKQSPIQVDRWIDLDSEEIKYKDDNLVLAKRWLRFGIEEGFLFVDTQGRIWGKGKDNYFFPYHFDYRGKLFGYRLSVAAAN